ncbi:Xyloside transporter XynT [Klebsiella michiganensis]|nr:Xyloside transporter XynT [Klebsiella michiganensis]
MSAGDKISVREKIGYSLGDAASHIVFDSSVAILAYFYTDIYGLPPAVMGTMFFAGSSAGCDYRSDYGRDC